MADVRQLDLWNGGQIALRLRDTLDQIDLRRRRAQIAARRALEVR
jgi:hypothetical protein